MGVLTRVRKKDVFYAPSFIKLITKGPGIPMVQKLKKESQRYKFPIHFIRKGLILQKTIKKTICLFKKKYF